MKQSLDKYICEKYPAIFVDRHSDMRKSCMTFGFEHGDGWFHLIDSLSHSIQSYIDSHHSRPKRNLQNYLGDMWNRFIWNPILYPLLYRCLPYHRYQKCFRWFSYSTRYEEYKIPQVIASQVKEKFGGLRFYYTGGDNEIRGMVYLAEAMSYRICENCGTMNELVTQNSRGWIRTLCPCCVPKQLKDNYEEYLNLKLIEACQAKDE